MTNGAHVVRDGITYAGSDEELASARRPDTRTGAFTPPAKLGMRVLAIVQEADAGPGVFAEAVAARGHELDEWLIAEGGDPPADPRGYDAVMVFGGAMNVDDEDEHPWLGEQKALLRDLLDAGVPLLGVCLGAQLLAEAAGRSRGGRRGRRSGGNRSS